MANSKVETNIIISTASSPIARASMLPIIYVETSYLAYVIVFISNVMCLTSHGPIIFSAKVSLLIQTI